MKSGCHRAGIALSCCQLPNQTSLAQTPHGATPKPFFGARTMLRCMPFAGDYPIIKPFGAPPTGAATAGGPRPHADDTGSSLLGHEGVDLALPVGTPVRAVHEGSVIWAGDASGYGQSVLIEHVWGQSVYAQLAEVHVRAGERVDAAQQVGLSGGEEGGGAAHLHFGMRVRPYSGADGWYGYCDPLPYMARVERGRGAIIGPHILGGVHRHLELLERWQPRLIVVVDPNPDEMRELRRVCPEAAIIGRVYAPDGEVSDRIQADARAAATWAHELTQAHMSPHVDFWQVANEVHQSTNDLPLLNDFELARMALAETAGYRCALFGFAVGNPDLPNDDRIAAWRILYPALARAERNGHCVAVHQYAAPDMTKPTIDWHIHRLEHQVLRRIPFKKLQFAVTEFGLDGLLQGPDPAGWRSLSTANAYVDGLLRAGGYLERFSGRVMGYAVYSLGVTGPWASYDINGEVATMLADRSERGTWAHVNTESGGLDAAESDSLSGPGGTDTAPPPPTDPAEPPPSPALERRVSEWVSAFNMAIKPIAERPDDPPVQDGLVFLIKDVFTTRNGSWEPTDQPGSIPQWARDSYLSADFEEAGADHHLFGAVLGLDGKLVPDQALRFWSDGFDSLGNPAYEGYVDQPAQEKSRWANLVLFSGSSFMPERGESGPWCWTTAGRAEVMAGGGLPANQHISTFVIWQAVPAEIGEAPPTVPVTPPQPPTEPPSSEIPRRLGSWVEYLKTTIKRISERPDKPQGQIAYVIKDVFTTRDGTWEPAGKMGSVDAWAREAYLKPWGAPDYFDDAGADHHIFAYVLGLDGKFVPDAEIRYWSDGFEQLGNPTYDGYVLRRTKVQSGWANIPMDGGANYFPESGQQGPWCWAPEGASEVFCGGGMPSNNHVSFFVVWQAVRQEAPPLLPGDNHIFLPWVAGPSQELPLPPVIAPDAGGPDETDAGGGKSQPSGGTPSVPRPTPVGTEDVALRTLREDAWLRVGIESSHETLLAAYARRVGLGMPVTHEFTSGDFTAQGFAGGIVFSRTADAVELTHIAW